MAFATFNYNDQIDGDSFEVTNINFFDGSDIAIDLTGAVPKMVFRRKSFTGKIVKTLTVGDGLEWVDQSAGQLRQNDFLIDWGAGDYYYDLQLTYADGKIYTYLRGQVEVLPQSTI